MMLYFHREEHMQLEKLGLAAYYLTYLHRIVRVHRP